jgi:hypothetical protein
MDESTMKIGYATSLTWRSCQPTPIRILAKFQPDIRALEAETDNLIA